MARHGRHTPCQVRMSVPPLPRSRRRYPMRIQEIMTKDPSCVTPDATVREAAQLMSREDVGIIPVVEGRSDKRLVGVVTDRDIAIRCVAEGKDASCLVRDVMSSDDLATCSESDEVDSVMEAMRGDKVRRIP